MAPAMTGSSILSRYFASVAKLRPAPRQTEVVTLAVMFPPASWPSQGHRHSADGINDPRGRWVMH